jgi:hypothetical protein
MSVSLETYLVKLYLDRDARRTFLANPRGAATAEGLAEPDVAALERIDRDGLELAAQSFARKRQAQRPRGFWARLRACGRAWRTRKPPPPRALNGGLGAISGPP